jgi:hypothetical protein
MSVVKKIVMAVMTLGVLGAAVPVGVARAEGCRPDEPCGAPGGSGGRGAPTGPIAPPPAVYDHCVYGGMTQIGEGTRCQLTDATTEEVIAARDYFHILDILESRLNTTPHIAEVAAWQIAMRFYEFEYQERGNGVSFAYINGGIYGTSDGIYSFWSN